MEDTFSIGPDLNDGLAWDIYDGYMDIASWWSVGWDVVGSGPFIGQRAYMGIAFYIGDDLHYGWLDLEVSDAVPFARLYGWGYETEANLAICAGVGSPLTIPEPGTLTLLALGGGFLAYLRRRTTSSTPPLSRKPMSGPNA